jgi:hypothetical protein
LWNSTALLRPWIVRRRFLRWGGDDACVAFVRETGIRSIEKYGEAAAAADEKNQINEQPNQPPAMPDSLILPAHATAAFERAFARRKKICASAYASLQCGKRTSAERCG